MAQDIRKLLERDQASVGSSMPKGHEERFLEKLEKELPESKRTTSFPWMKIAAGFVILLGLGFASYQFFKSDPITEGTEIVETKADENEVENGKSLGDISPDLKKVEDYYLATINLELSKVKYSPENKELLDGYLQRLDELTKEYKRLTQELNTSGPNELTVNALIDNLKFRLNLLYKLRNQIAELQSVETNDLEKQSS